MGYKISVEVPVFLVFFGFTLTLNVTNNFLIYRTCYVLLPYNQSECAKLGFVNNNETQHLEQLVEPTATYISLVKNIIESTFGSVLCLFIAPWSDKFGRKPILMLGLLGGCIAMLLCTILAALPYLSPWYLLLTSVPVVLSGGAPSFITILNAYLTDTTTKEERALRLGLFDVAMAIALLLGNSSSSYLLIATNYVTVYCISIVCHVLALIYTIFFIKESLRERDTNQNPISGLFSLSNILEMTKTPFKRRENSKRTILLLLMGSILFKFMTEGSMKLFFYFVREKFQWSLTQYTWFGTINTILGVLGAIIVVYILHTKLKIRESVLIFAGSIFAVCSSIVYGFASTDWPIYLGAVMNLPTSGQDSLIRSYISKLVYEDEIAKILSVFSIGSTIIGLLSSIGYTTMYNHTISTNPGLYNFVTAGITTCFFGMFLLILLVQQRSTNDYTSVESSHEEPEENVCE
ncbi:hypothetical protein ABEB36_008081 [Hypothenemus hampei]|uniref:Major facilitator superfamily (MFS) profile domain-containing protein n=1 Tax=Hypothenemus hampei TaxID=57062 RepID=A0ABD1EKM4_HYPHA